MPTGNVVLTDHQAALIERLAGPDRVAFLLSP